MSAPRLRRVVALTTAVVAAGSLLVACSDSEAGGVDYLIDARVASSNANTRDGYADGALMALNRVLPGFSMIGPDGQFIADRDIGTATLVEAAPMTVRYEVNPKAVYSDGKPITCDDLLLAATAFGDKARGFDAATRAGYADIDTVDCAPGSKTATVRFTGGVVFEEWAGLFGAGTLLPAHVVGRLAGVSNVGAAIRAQKPDELAKIAKAWNTGFALTPGKPIDPSVHLSSGPYRLESYSADQGLKLAANDKWWGQSPVHGDITIWPRGTSGDSALADGRIDVVDSANLAAADKVAGRPEATSQTRKAARDTAPLSVTSLVFAKTGIGADLTVRRALATCMPRTRIAQAHGANAIVWSVRSATPADPLGPSLNVQYGRRYPRSDTSRAKALLAERTPSADGTRPKPVIRIGYPTGSTADKDVVEQIAKACAPAGFTVKDVSAPDFEVSALGRTADAVLLAGDTFAAAGTSSGIPAIYSLFPRDPLNLSGFSDLAVGRAITALAGTSSDSARLPLLRTIESAAWDALPSIPLYGTVRGRGFTAGMKHVVPGLGRSGTGWNMDRWGGTA